MPHSELLRWDSEDRAKLAAFLIESSAKCQMCGTSDWEWEDDRNAYEPMIRQCWGCYMKDGAREQGNELVGSRVVLMPRKHVEELSYRKHKIPALKKE